MDLIRRREIVGDRGLRWYLTRADIFQPASYRLAMRVGRESREPMRYGDERRGERVFYSFGFVRFENEPASGSRHQAFRRVDRGQSDRRG